MLCSNLQEPLSLPSSTHPGGHWHKLQLTKVPRFKGFWVWGRVVGLELSDLNKLGGYISHPQNSPDSTCISEVLARPPGSLWCDVARWLVSPLPRNQGGSGMGPCDSAGAHQQPPAHGCDGHQPCPPVSLEGSHHSSPGRQGPQEKGAPPQALVVTRPQREIQTHSHQKSFSWKEGPSWAGTHRPSQNPGARSHSFPTSGYSWIYPHRLHPLLPGN